MLMDIYSQAILGKKPADKPGPARKARLLVLRSVSSFVVPTTEKELLRRVAPPRSNLVAQ